MATKAEETDQPVKLVSRKTGQEQIMSAKDADQHMKLHSRKFTNRGPVEEFEPEEATATKGSKRKALPQGGPVAENEQPSA